MKIVILDKGEFSDSKRSRINIGQARFQDQEHGSFRKRADGHSHYGIHSSSYGIFHTTTSPMIDCTLGRISMVETKKKKGRDRHSNDHAAVPHLDEGHSSGGEHSSAGHAVLSGSVGSGKDWAVDARAGDSWLDWRSWGVAASWDDGGNWGVGAAIWLWCIGAWNNWRSWGACTWHNWGGWSAASAGWRDRAGHSLGVGDNGTIASLGVGDDVSDSRGDGLDSWVEGLGVGHHWGWEIDGDGLNGWLVGLGVGGNAVGNGGRD
jgi:hypothetical protein